MADTIGVKLKVSGETQYSKAMKEAAKNVKSLDAELKLAEKEFQRTGNAEELMTTKSKVLKTQISEEEKAVEAAKKMLADLAKNGYAENSTKVIEWRGRLAQAQAQLVDLNNELANNEQGLDKNGKAYETASQDVADLSREARSASGDLDLASGSANGLQTSLDNIGKNTGWKDIHDALASVNDKIADGIRKAVQLGKALWEAGVDAASWADELNENAVKYGLDTDTLQQWQYAARFVDTSVETIVGARTKLLNNMGSTSEEVVKAFNSLGVRTREVNGSFRDQNDVFWDAIDALGKIDDETTRDAMAMKIFGKSAKELNPLIAAGREEWEKYANSAPVVSKEKVEALGKADDALQDMNAQLEALKLDVLAYMAPIMEQVGNAIAGAAAELRAFLETPEGQEALTSLQNAISGLITDFTTMDFGVTLKDAAKSVSDIIKGIADFLSDKEAVENAITGIGIAIGGLKLAEVGASILSIVSSLSLIGIGKGAAAASASAAAGAGAAGAAAGTSWATAFAAAAVKAVPWLAFVAGVVTPAETGNDDYFDEDGHPTPLAKENGITHDQSWYEDHPTEQPRYNGIRDDFDVLQDWWDAFRSADYDTEEGREREEALWQELGIRFGDDWGTLSDAIYQWLDSPEYDENLEDLPEDWLTELNNSLNDTITSVNQTQETIEDSDAGNRETIQRVAGAMVGALGQMRVNIDGRLAGSILAPTIEAIVAEQLTSRRYG